MTNEQCLALVQGIYDTIFEASTSAEPGGKPVSNSEKTMLTLMKPGWAIRPEDYRNPWTPGNLEGSMPAAVNNAALADIIPNANALFEDSGKVISKVYLDILDSVSIPKQPSNPSIDKQLEDAWNVLHRYAEVTDADTGKKVTRPIESEVYRDYLNNQKSYFDLRAAYIAAYKIAQQTPEGRSTWPLIAPTMEIPVKQAWDKWKGNKADLVEQNLAIQQTSSQNSLQKAFKRAQDLFLGYGVILEDTVSGMSEKIYRSGLVPTNWHNADDATGWVKVDISTGKHSSSSSSDFSSFGGSSGFNAGIWSVGLRSESSWSSQHFSMATENLSFEFSFKFVSIRRPWLSLHLLDTDSWNLGNLLPKKGAVSNGTKNQKGKLWPLLPTGFVVAKDIRIKAHFSDADWHAMQETVSSGGSVGIGPFKIGGSYFRSSSSSQWQSTFANGVITAPGIQIIGFLNTIVPFCPPENMPGS
jgi:hypothetical protein